jgi:putative flippase GtrA
MSVTLIRWMKFNLVGAIGIVVQLAVLFLLKNVLNFNYLWATALAVEAAVIHNFIWHERFTWADRTKLDRMQASSARSSLLRCFRFNLSNGAVSILGNLALMKLLVGFGHVNYLAANGIAIALCSLANFLVSEEWVFANPSTNLPHGNEMNRSLKSNSLAASPRNGVTPRSSSTVRSVEPWV